MLRGELCWQEVVQLAKGAPLNVIISSVPHGFSTGDAVSFVPDKRTRMTQLQNKFSGAEVYFVHVLDNESTADGQRIPHCFSLHRTRGQSLRCAKSLTIEHLEDAATSPTSRKLGSASSTLSLQKTTWRDQADLEQGPQEASSEPHLPMLLGRQREDESVFVRRDPVEAKELQLKLVYERKFPGQGTSSIDGSVEVLPVTDLRTTWSYVVFDACIAILGLVPVLGLLPILYILYKYNFKKRHVILQHLGGMKYTASATFELALVLAVLGSKVSEIIRIWERRQHLLEQIEKGHGLVRLMECFEYTSISMICAIASLLFSRILLVNKEKVYAHLAVHKADEEQFLAGLVSDSASDHRSLRRSSFSMASVEGVSKGKRVLDHLLIHFAFLFDPEETAYDMFHFPENFGLTEKFLIGFSTLDVVVGMASVAQVITEKKKVTWATYGAHALLIGITAIEWFCFARAILSSALKVRRNMDQLLIFAAVVDNNKEALWPRDIRSKLRKILDQADFLNQDTEVCLTSDCKATSLRNIDLAFLTDRDLCRRVSCFFPEDVRLDLTRHDDLAAWWYLRRYIMIDQTDESCVMEYCCSMMLLLILCFASVAFTDYALHTDLLTARTMYLAVGLVVCLALMMDLIIVSCIDINSLLDADAQLLLDTCIESSFSDRSVPGELFHALERRISVFADGQRLFGIRITSKMREGLFTSVGLTLLTYAAQFLHYLQGEPMQTLLKDWAALPQIVPTP
eukprot:TRINITY_DN61173_c0_g1_i1.p1 TRINITY_DN61173_c0_g1~~TRINITY_DN61173_c0_g1_i1.p1  ORF type:complete len:741 (+),score=151.01 TRINITY_DN61173_c0_g1_i1:268-2490(+)